MSQDSKLALSAVERLINLVGSRYDNAHVVRRILNGAGWSALAAISTRGALLVSMLVTARILSAEGFGQYALVQSTLLFFEVFAAAGMGVTASTFVSRYKNSDRKKCGEYVGFVLLVSSAVSLFIMLVVLSGSEVIASILLGDPDLRISIILVAVVLFFNAVNGALVGLITGFEFYKAMAKLNLVSSVLALGSVPVGALYGGLTGAFVGLLVVSIVTCILNACVVLKALYRFDVTPSIVVNSRYRSVFRKFSLPAIAAGILVAPVVWMGNAYLSAQPGGLESLGVFYAANQWFALLLFVPSMVTNSSLPVISSAVADGDLKAASSHLIASVKIALLSVVPLAIAVSLLSPKIMALYGGAYSEGAPVLILVSATAVLAASNNMIGNYFYALGKAGTNLLVNGQWGICFIALLVVMLGNIAGELAMALAFAGAYLMKLILQILLLRALPS